MQYKIPQFIDREATIVGPLSFRQFLFFGAAAAVSFTLWPFLAPVNMQLYLGISGVCFVIAIGLAFGKVEGRNLGNVVISAFYFLTTPKIYLWKRKNSTIRFSAPVKEVVEEEEKPRPSVHNFKRNLDFLSDQIELE
jgi:hypothetical protein